MYFIAILSITAFIFLLDFKRLAPLISRLQKGVSHFSPVYLQGQTLYNEIIGIRSSEKSLSEYKFFDELIYEVLESSKRFGTPKDNAIFSIKKALMKDIQSEKKLTKLYSSSILTFLAASLITWVFSYYSSMALGRQLSFSFIIIAISWQLTGLVLFFFIYKKLNENTLRPFDRVFKSFYLLNLFIEISLPVGEILKTSKVSAIFVSKIKGIETLKERIVSLVEVREKQGANVKQDFRSLVEELWLLYDEHCHKLEKKVTILKFLWLCVFFFSVYLASIFNILGAMAL
jgi:hypothetical protein